MKAIIMAGGEGSRLRPLTCERPKPMVPVMNRPIMTHIINLLKGHGFIDIGVTLQYMPEVIRDHFGNGADHGVNLRYFLEEIPLGTAGSVKNAQDFLDETFLVISGDALTDLDLTRAVEFHKSQGAMATLVLTRVDCPLEYGVVITEQNGKIKRFLEKPAWGEVFSDTVNTGIYVLEPEVLNYFEPGQKFDFSKDLFPLLLRDNKPIFGVVLSGYWCDIGNLQQYLQAHHDALSGLVRISLPGQEIKPGVWVGSGVSLNDTSRIQGPALIGDECYISNNVTIEPYTVIGSGCILHEHSSVKRSVMWNNGYLGTGASLRGAVTGSRVQIYARAGLYEGAVVGSNTIIKEGSIIKPDVKIWPNKLVEAGAVVQNSLVWGTNYPKKIFGLEGISGFVNTEITPEYASRLAAAYASTACGKNGLAVSADSSPYSQMLKSAVLSGVQSAGAQAYDFGTCITPVHRFGVRNLNLSGGIHIKASHRQAGQVTMIFTNGKGGNVSRNTERKIENLFLREDFRRADSLKIMPPRRPEGLRDSYITSITETLDLEAVRKANLRIMASYNGADIDNILQPLARHLNIGVSKVDAEGHSQLFNKEALRELMPDLSKALISNRAAAGAMLDPNGDRLVLIDETGRVVEEELLTALLALMVLRRQGGPVVVPVTAPRAIDHLARRYNSSVVRTKTSIPDFFDKVMSQDDLSRQQDENSISQFLLNFDAIGALICILEFSATSHRKISELVDEVPAFFMDRREVPVPWESKGRVIRQLIEDPPTPEIELLDGVKVYHNEGWALVLPDPDEPLCRVFSEGASMEIAQSLSDFYIERINQIIEPRANSN